MGRPRLRLPIYFTCRLKKEKEKKKKVNQTGSLRSKLELSPLAPAFDCIFPHLLCTSFYHFFRLFFVSLKLIELFFIMLRIMRFTWNCIRLLMFSYFIGLLLLILNKHVPILLLVVEGYCKRLLEIVLWPVVDFFTELSRSSDTQGKILDTSVQWHHVLIRKMVSLIRCFGCLIFLTSTL